MSLKEPYASLIADTLSLLRSEISPLAVPMAKPQKSAPSLPVTPPVTPVVATTQPPAPVPAPVQTQARPALAPPVTPPVTPPVNEMRQRVAATLPHFRLRNAVLDDAMAKRIANAWKEQAFEVETAVLSFGETPEASRFLHQLAQAIHLQLSPCKVVDAARLEKEKKWDLFLKTPSLKRIIAPHRMIGKSPELAKYYKEYPATSERRLGDLPVWFLSSFQDYFKNPALKKSLWDTLCKHLSLHP